MAEINQIINNRYKILRRIGEGGMSSVYLALDTNLNKRWALKEIRKEGTDKNNDIFLSSAIAEANLMKRLDHPYLPRIVDIIDKDGYLYVVMDYIEGETLGAVLQKKGTIPEKQVLEWAIDLCNVLGYLHSQTPPIIYRDMKPDNIMLTPNGQIKLIDFGIAREYKTENHKDTVCLGTKGYAAPEQFGGKGQSDKRTDIYCLGVTLYHLLTGKNPCEPPYRLYPIRHWNQSLSPGLEAIIIKCTEPNPLDRYNDSDELKYALLNHEKEDEGYRRKKRRILRAFQIFLSLSILFLISGILVKRTKTTLCQNEYDKQLYMSDIAVTVEDKTNYVLAAMDINPSEITAYEKLIELFKEDGILSSSEENLLMSIISENMEILREGENYGIIAYDIGRLYWYYLKPSEESGITAMRTATSWFEEAISSNLNEEYLQKANLYYLIGTFYKNITISSIEEMPTGTYLDYFNNINTLIKLLRNEEDTTIILSSTKLIYQSVVAYGYCFYREGVTIEDINQILNVTDELVQQAQVISEKNQLLKEHVNDLSIEAREFLEELERGGL